MKMQNFRIRFDDYQQYYRPGDRVKGRVTFSVPQMIKVRVLKLNFSGICKVKWTVSTNDDEKTYKSKETYLDNLIFLIGSEGSHAEITIAGQQVHHFQISLPQNIPSTFKGKYGEISYSVTLTAEFPGTFASDESYTEAFQVTNPINLFSERPWSEFVHKQLQLMADQADDSCCGSSSDRIRFDVTTNKGAYDPGESVVLNGYAMNQSSRATQSVFMELVQNLTFYGRRSDFSFTSSGNLKYKQKRYVVALWKGENVTARSRVIYSNRNSLRIPEGIVESGLRNCNSINVDYVIKYVVEMPGMCSMSLSYSIPIYIGNGNSQNTRNDIHIAPSAPPQPVISQFEPAMPEPVTAPLPTYEDIRFTDKDKQPPPPSYASAMTFHPSPDAATSEANTTLSNDTTRQGTYYDWSQSAFTYN